MVKMEIISKESIKPSSKTPDRLRTFRLSMLDQFTPPSSYVPLILYYSYDESTSNVKQAKTSSLLKRSLSDALSLYYPLAGRMTSESAVDYNDQGVDFLEARVDASLSEILRRPQVKVLTQFVPSTSEGSGGFLLGIQSNYFNCGGIAIVISISHRTADACTLSMFVKAWAATARGNTNTVTPSFVTSSLFPPKKRFGQPMSFESPKHWADTRRFCFSSSKIAALRAEVGATVVQPTRVEVVTATIWKRAMAQKGRDQCRRSVACHAVNIRGRMDPPLPECTFGNLVWGADVSGYRELDLGELVSKMREAVGKIDGEFLKELQGENGYDVAVRHSNKAVEWFLDKEVDCFLFTSWCRFPFYESDFSWG
ncbi:stemmadenine O-acetyltransferase-like [Rhododendron vialii]|uniref:stemmadenine O-acetyltransferase-like n=1 Tax=Rhododendron vialii TaxID=182163 RepID=UPI00265F6BFB|nr:stemmadenine O-acetyltransferase-like [Rhododendron vialii]